MLKFSKNTLKKWRGTYARAAALALAFFFLPAGSARAEDARIDTAQTATITSACTVTLPERLLDKAYRITDGLVETYQTFRKDDAILLELPHEAQGLYLEWYDATERYSVVQLDESGAALTEDAAAPFINAYYPLRSETRSVRIALSDSASLSTLAVYGMGELPASVQRWAPTEAGDLMILAATPRAALTDFYGVIAAYAANRDVPAALVVLSRETRTAQEELLAALWQTGIAQYPIFGGFACDNNESYNLVRAQWGKSRTASFLTDLLAAYAPTIVVTHMDSGSAASGAVQFTGEYALPAATKANVPKVYLAGGEGTTLAYDFPLNGLGGMTVLEAAANAYAMCPSMRAFVPALSPTASFQLALTALGPDDAGDDLFEHVDTALLGAYADPTPTPTATPEPTPEPTLEPESGTPADEPASAAGLEQAARNPGALQIPTVVFYIIPAVGLVLSLIVFLLYDARRRARNRTRRRARRVRGKAIVLALLPLLLSTLIAGGLFLLRYLASERTSALPAPTSAPTASPSPTPEPEPSEEPEMPVEETPAPAAASAGDEFYRQADDPAEVIVVDEENGHWEYRNDVLSILIDRIDTEYTNYGGRAFPQVIFIAHIRMRGIDSFRTAQAAEYRNGQGAIKPWILARRNKAVLMITGDNLIQSDSEFKSILLRGGKVFLDEDNCDVLAMYPGLTMRIFSPKETSASELLMDGVRDAFSFGPTLIRDGALASENLDRAPRIGNETNPRTGIGMVEPGHFVAIVADGRRKFTYSHGMRLSAFADLFITEGCVEAYNLDGGISTCMLFMGEQINQHGNNHVGNIEDSYQRRVPDGLVWGYSETVPAEDDPIYNRGEG